MFKYETKKLNALYLKALFKVIIEVLRPDAIWIGRPDNIDILPTTKVPIIYDCMDDYYSMHNDVDLLNQEEKVINTAKCIFASSASLISKIRERYHTTKSIVLVRNGYDGNIISLDKPHKNTEHFTLCYVGTVSVWFDFDLIDKIAESVPGIRIIVIGPIESAVNEKVDSYKYSNVVFAQILTLIDNMFEFDLDSDIIKEVLNPKITYYKLNNEFRETINDIIEVKKEQKYKK